MSHPIVCSTFPYESPLGQIDLTLANIIDDDSAMIKTRFEGADFLAFVDTIFGDPQGIGEPQGKASIKFLMSEEGKKGDKLLYLVQLYWAKPYQKMKGRRLDFLQVKKTPLEGMEAIIPFRSMLKKVMFFYQEDYDAHKPEKFRAALVFQTLESVYMLQTEHPQVIDMVRGEDTQSELSMQKVEMLRQGNYVLYVAHNDAMNQDILTEL